MDHETAQVLEVQPVHTEIGPPVVNSEALLDAPPSRTGAKLDVRPIRIPHLGHLSILGALSIAGFMGSGILVAVALHFNVGGVSSLDQIGKSMGYNLGFAIALYTITLALAAAIFPRLWRKSLQAGLQWNLDAAKRMWRKLVGIGVVQFGLIVGLSRLFHVPGDSPIKALLKTPGTFWMMFAFGVTIAPLCEEIVFRGFILPAVCTACDWLGERVWSTSPPDLLAGGHPRWSLAAITIGSILTSLLFALVHAPQLGLAVGPLLLLFTAGLILCVVRLVTRSLAASVIVHLTYNLSIFVLSAVSRP